MEGKKKRMRPTVAQMKELEERIGTLQDEKATLESTYESQLKHYTYMADELERLREERRELEKEVFLLKRENTYLINRGFWARMFNR